MNTETFKESDPSGGAGVTPESTEAEKTAYDEWVKRRDASLLQLP